VFDQVKPGDMIASSGRDLGSLGIQVATLSLPNIWPLRRWAGVHHVGIIVPVCGHNIVYESTSAWRPKCVRTNREEPKGVQAHHLSDILDLGGDVWHYPLRRPLYDHEEMRLLDAAEECLGQGYDFIGAGRSGGGLLMRMIAKLKGCESMDLVFCSELVLWLWIQTGIAQNKHAGMNPAWLTRWALAKGIVGKPSLLS